MRFCLVGIFLGRVTYVADDKGKVFFIFEDSVNATIHISKTIEDKKKYHKITK